MIRKTDGNLKNKEDWMKNEKMKRLKKVESKWKQRQIKVVFFGWFVYLGIMASQHL